MRSRRTHPTPDVKRAPTGHQLAAAPEGKGGAVGRWTDELGAAVGAPRYGRDPAYTKDVEQKVVRSNRFGHVRKA